MNSLSTSHASPNAADGVIIVIIIVGEVGLHGRHYSTILIIDYNGLMVKFVSLRSGFVDISNRLFFKRILPPRYSHAVKNLSSDLKQQSLLFDEIGIYEARKNLDSIRNDPSYKDLLDTLNEMETELAWLIEKKVVFDLGNRRLDQKTLEREDVKELLSKQKNNDKEINDMVENIVNHGGLMQWGKLGNTAIIEKYIKPLLVSDVLAIRLLAVDLGDSPQMSVIPYLPHESNLNDLQGSYAQDVISVVINKLPVPDETTPWEKILDYRLDSESRNNLIALRRWMTKLSSEKLSAKEIEQELEWSINEFQRFMNIHKIKANTETLEVLVKAPLEFIGNLVTLNFSKIIDPLFVLQKRKILLLEAEASAPGREIAYIMKTRDAFS